MLLCLAAGAAAAEFKIGPDATVDSLALCAGDQNFLTVWRDTASARLRGSTVTTTGVASADFAVSDAGSVVLENPVQRCNIAFDSNKKNYLVVWADNRAGGPGLRGALVSASGTVAGGADFLIAPLSRTDSNFPLATFNGSAFLVAWQDAADSSGGSGSRIFYANVSDTGAPGAITGLPIVSGQDQHLEFLSAGPASESLLVWQDVAATPNVTRGTRLSSAGQILGAQEGAYLFQRDFGATGFGVPIGVTFDGTAYVVLSSFGAQIDSTVFPTRLQQDGTVIRPSNGLIDVGQGTTGLVEDDFPRTFLSGPGELLFVRNSKVSDICWHLLFKRVLFDGTDRDPNTPVFDGASQGVLNGAVAGFVGGQCLIAWMDGRRGGAQPERQLNVFGYILDSTQVSDQSKPYIKAVAHAYPVIGNSPMTVTFGNGGSTGVIDQQFWQFGDGFFTDVGVTTHKYESKGEFTAVYSLWHSGFAMRDFVRISVDQSDVGGTGGPPQIVVGSLGPVSSGIDTEILVSSFTALLSFSQTNADALRFVGYINPSVLPAKLGGVAGTFSIGNKTWPFTLTNSGTYVSDTTKTPLVRMGVNSIGGGFTLSVDSEALQDLFAGLGAKDETIAKPGKTIEVPYAFTFGTLNLEAKMTATYIATAGKNGRVSFAFAGTGSSGSGYFRIFSTDAKQTGKTTPTHTLTAIGNLGWADGHKIVKADSGRWRITLGNYTEDIPVGSLTLNGTMYRYLAPKSKVGITELYFNQQNGQIGVLIRNLPAEGAVSSGMPLATSNFSRVDLAFSVDMDLKEETFQGSAYARLIRKKVGGARWVTR
jgi:hypothetical protein